MRRRDKERDSGGEGGGRTHEVERHFRAQVDLDEVRDAEVVVEPRGSLLILPPERIIVLSQENKNNNSKCSLTETALLVVACCCYVLLLASVLVVGIRC